ncbi:LLM class flavin-dependent oxidoreductase [Amnibacterium soli]|uniref:LLM class flavin-dependent oxidoreductase n=1 Tax=Amnibacterium soli TaxID=1282736 RepID=A0ABP8YX84_9MICO
MENVLFGLDTFGDVPHDDRGRPMSYAASIRQVVDEAVLADELGIDAIALGEHHRPEYAISTPETVLAGIATRTSRIRLGSGVTVLSSDDPVRVFQRFATLDALSNGRAEVILGRGSFTESFPLFGYDLRDYDVLFEEKLDLFARLLQEEPVTWSGTTRAALEQADVFPKTEHGLRTWVGIGGSPESVVRTARYGLPLMIAIIGGAPQRFLPYLDLYRRATAQLETTAWPVGVHSPGFVAATDEEAKETLWPHMKEMRDRIGALRGWPPMQREEFEAEIAHGSLYVGSPETVARKVAATVSSLGIGRFDLIYTSGTVPASARLKHVELYGGTVVPMVKELLAERTDSLAGAA